MAENKNQHYVPKAYLKQFSVDGKSVSVFTRKTEHFASTSSIRRMCSKDYFYGKSSGADEILTELETFFGGILADPHLIVEMKKGPTDAWEKALCFIMSQLFRTPITSENVRKKSEALARSIFRKEEDADAKVTQYVEETSDPALIVEEGLASYAHVCDLDACIVEVPDGGKLVTSDYPAVITNFGAISGVVKDNAVFEAAGLVIYLPVSSTKALLLFDKDVYETVSSCGTILRLTSKDVDTLNCLQCQNGGAILILENGGPNEFRDILDSAKGLRESCHTVLETEFPAFFSSEKGASQKVGPFPYIHDHTTFPEPKRLLSCLSLKETPEFNRRPDLSYDVRLADLAYPATAYVNHVASGSWPLFRFWHFVPALAKSLEDRK
jgi:hypothetical protein